jgi:hypothetical protein
VKTAREAVDSLAAIALEADPKRKGVRWAIVKNEATRNRFRSIAHAVASAVRESIPKPCPYTRCYPHEDFVGMEMERDAAIAERDQARGEAATLHERVKDRHAEIAMLERERDELRTSRDAALADAATQSHLADDYFKAREAMKVELERAERQRDEWHDTARDIADMWSRTATRFRDLADLAMTEGLAECERLRASLDEWHRWYGEACVDNRRLRRRTNGLTKKSNRLRAKVIAMRKALNHVVDNYDTWRANNRREPAPPPWKRSVDVAKTALTSCADAGKK